jgi:broad specificity phosphatase PhoE
LSSLYLFRHGQAGLRDNYDTLSEIGMEQAKRLGEHLAAQKMEFRRFYTGALKRQQQTASQICEAYRAAGLPVPEPVIDAHWNEFDLSSVYDGIAPQLANDDADFARDYEDLQKESADNSSTVHRRWTPSDINVVRAWIEGRYHYDGESWIEFKSRVTAAFEALRNAETGEAIAVSTSATPVAVWVGMSMELANRYIMRAAGALYNASITSFRVRDGEPYLFTFNNIPHLPHAALRTFR